MAEVPAAKNSRLEADLCQIASRAFHIPLFKKEGFLCVSLHHIAFTSKAASSSLDFWSFQKNCLEAATDEKEALVDSS